MQQSLIVICMNSKMFLKTVVSLESGRCFKLLFHVLEFTVSFLFPDLVILSSSLVTVGVHSNQRLPSVGDNDGRSQTLLLQRCALAKFYVIDDAFPAFHSFFVEIQTKLAMHVSNMRNSNLQIRTAGSSCRLQKC